ncbi:MAG TPA: glycosyltransferase family 39 protein [Chitinophagaceae bacterium]|nr:glycosyltransferase family 39 protein [Chitinophagaceae bacterium]
MLKSNFSKRYQFDLWIILIAFTGGVIRYININYSSLWGDELFSMYNAHPSNSWYEMLYVQKALQPPLYVSILWVGAKVFALTEFYARLLSVMAGVAGIIVSGYLGKKIKNANLGIAMSILVAFNPVHIMYSLEARFYIFVYLFAALSLLLYWHLIEKKPRSYFFYFLKSCVDAALCYFHHFGIVFVFAQFVFDCFLYFKEKDGLAFRKKLSGYALSALFYLPWLYWGIIDGFAIKSYWLKKIDILDYISFSLGYPLLVNILAAAFIAYFIFRIYKNNNLYLKVLPLICFLTIFIPALYSVLRVPILVNRYSMVMAPVIYLMVLIAFLAIAEKLFSGNYKFKVLFISICMLLISLPGLNLTLVNKTKLVKQPWREIGIWLKQQNDYNTTSIYSHNVWIKNFRYISFYLDSSNKAKDLLKIEVGSDQKMYLVGTSGYWAVPDSILSKVNVEYNVQKVLFNEKYDTTVRGSVYICTKKLP